MTGSKLPRLRSASGRQKPLGCPSYVERSRRLALSGPIKFLLPRNRNLGALSVAGVVQAFFADLTERDRKPYKAAISPSLPLDIGSVGPIGARCDASTPRFASKHFNAGAAGRLCLRRCRQEAADLPAMARLVQYRRMGGPAPSRVHPRQLHMPAHRRALHRKGAGPE